MDEIEVLLVDDKTDLLEQAGFYLEKEKKGITTETSNSAEKALEMLEKADFDAVVSDYQMPGMDGLEFLKTLRNRGEDIPFIIFTGKSREEVAMEALNLGADRYLQKGRDPRSQYGVLADAVVQEVKHWRREKLLRESEKEKDLVLNNTSELVIHQDIDHTVVWANRAAAESVDVKPKDMVGQKCYEVWQGRDKPCEGCPLEEALEEGGSQEGEIIASDGRIWSVRGSLVWDESGEIEGFIETILDITERKQAEEMANQTIESMEDGILVCDMDGVINLVNPALKEMTGYEEEEVIGRNITNLASEIVSSDDLEESMERLELVLGGEAYSPITINLNSKEGEEIPVSIKGSIIRDDEGNPLKVVLSVRDIRERKWAEEELKKSETKYRTIFESANDAIFIMDDEKFVDCNEKTLEMFNCEREEIIGVSPWEFSPPKQPDGRDSEKKAKEKINAAFAGESQKFDWVHSKADGEKFNAEVSLNRYELEDEGYVLAVVRDVTERKEKEKELRERDDLLEAVFDAADEIIFTKDKEGRYHLANEVFAESFGRSLDDIIGKTDFQIFPEEEAEEIREIDKKIMESGEPVRNTDILTVQGETKIFDTSKVPLRDEDGEIIGVCGFAKDVSESRRAREIARETLESMEDAILVHDMSGKIVSVNPAFEKITGYEESELIGNNVREVVRELVKPADLERAMDGLETVLSGEGYSPIIINLISKDGKEIPVSLKGSVIKSEDGNPMRVIASARDVSELKELRRELRKEKELLESAMDSLEDAFAVLDFEGSFVRWNDKVNEISGYSNEELSSMNVIDLFAEEYEEKLLEGMERMVRGEVVKDEVTMISKEGKHIPIGLSGSLLSGRNGKPAGFVGIGRDITERKKKEEELQQAKRNYRELFEKSAEALFVHDSDTGEILNVNQRMCEMYGYSREEVLELVVGDLSSGKYPYTQEEAEKKIRKAKSEGPQIFEWRGRKKDGTLIWVEVTLKQAEIGGEERVLAGVRDITKRKEMERALRESEEKYRSLAENVSDVLIRIDPDGNYLYVSRNVEDEIGYSKDELIGSSIKEFLTPESYEEAKSRINKWKDGEERLPPYKVRVEAKDGRLIPFELNTSPIREEGELKAIQITARNIIERERALEKFERLFEASPDPAYLIDEEGVFREVNEALCEKSGFVYDEIVGESIRESPLFPEESKERILENMGRRMNGEEVSPYVIKGRMKDGEERYLEVNNQLLKEGGEIIGEVGIARDVTERRKASERIKKSEEKYRTLVEQSHDGIYIYWGDEFKFVNDRVCEITGYSEEELYQMSVWDLFYPEDRERVKSIGQRRQDGKEVPDKYEARIFTKDGEVRNLEFAVKSISYENERVALGAVRDITERKEIEEEVAERRAVLRSVLEGSRDSIYMVNEDCEYLIVNDELLSRLGEERDKVIGSKFQEFHSDVESENFEENVEKVFRTGEPVRQEHKKEDSDEWFLRTFSPVKDPETNEVLNVSITSKDITKRKEMEGRLREVKDKYEELFKGANEYVLTTDPDGSIKRVNRNVVKHSGYSEDELIGESVLKTIHPDYREEAIEFWQKVLEGKEETMTLKIETKDGGTVWLNAGGRPIIEDGEIVELQYNAQNITERKRAEEALLESEEKFRSIVENSHDGILIVGEDYRFTYVNDELCNILGYSRDELIGRDFRDFLDEESKDLVSDRYERRQAGEEIPSRYEFNVVRKDGGKRRVEISSTTVEDSEGKVKTIAQLLDITERERTREREEFLHSLLRHDLANKIQIISNALALLEDTNLSEDQEEFLEMCKKSSRRGFDLIEKVRTLKDIREEEEIEEVSLDSVIEVVISEKEPKASADGIEIDFERTKSKILAGPLLEEVFSNLIENSIQHSGCELIRIRGSVQGGDVVVIVEDDGRGVPDEEKSEVFERGYRSSGAGSGLGLHLVRRVVENYGGSVELKDSELGGARFDLYLRSS